MPYKDKDRDRRWHKLKMRERRAALSLNSRFVTPQHAYRPKIDADGNIIPE